MPRISAGTQMAAPTVDRLLHVGMALDVDPLLPSTRAAYRALVAAGDRLLARLGATEPDFAALLEARRTGAVSGDDTVSIPDTDAPAATGGARSEPERTRFDPHSLDEFLTQWAAVEGRPFSAFLEARMAPHAPRRGPARAPRRLSRRP